MRPLPELDCVRPADVEQAVALARRVPSRFVGGGTDLVPNMRRGLAPASCLVQVAHLPELRRIALAEDGGLVVGAAVTLHELASSVLVAESLPALVEAALAVGGPQHRAAGTVGGNLCQDTRCIYYNQGEWWRAANGYCLKYRGTRCHVAPQGERCHAAFCSDLAPVLLVAGALARIAGPRGLRTIPLQALYSDDGAAHLTLAPGELLVRVIVPETRLAIACGKLRQRGAIDFPLAAVAVGVHAGGARIALSGTGSCPVAFEVETEGGAPVGGPALRSAVLRHAACMRTTTTPGDWRREAAAALAARLLERAAASPKAIP